LGKWYKLTLGTSIIHAFPSLKQKSYMSTLNVEILTTCGSHKFKYFSTLCIGFVVHGFLRKCNNIQIVSTNYKFWYVIKLHCNNVDLVLTRVITFIIMFNYFMYDSTWYYTSLHLFYLIYFSDIYFASLLGNIFLCFSCFK
jgi:hypothetical protein